MIIENATSPTGPLERVFRRIELNASNFDEIVLNEPNLSENEKPKLKVVYFWGQDCPNCVSAGKNMAEMAPEFEALPIDFFSVNAYEQMDLAKRFGLYGIPVFLFFKKGRLIGRITSFPTQAEFLSALRRYV